MRITSKGQVTIPREIREKAGLVPGADVDFQIDDLGVRLVEAAPGAKRKTRGRKLVERLWDSGDVKMTTDEIMALMRGSLEAEDALPRK